MQFIIHQFIKSTTDIDNTSFKQWQLDGTLITMSNKAHLYKSYSVRLIVQLVLNTHSVSLETV